MMTDLSNRRIGGLLIAFAALGPASISSAAQIRGTVDPPSAGADSGQMLGYTRTRVVAASAQAASRRADVAIFLQAKESGVIPPPVEPYKVAIAGLKLTPSVAACVIDGKVAFTNEDSAPATLLIHENVAGVVAPGETFTYECKTGAQIPLKVRVKEWPHIRGALFVGDVGVVAQPNANGGFSLSAPSGKYELSVIGEAGAISTKPIEVKGGDVDAGKLALAGADAKPAEAAIEPAPAVESSPPKEAPKVEPVKREAPPPAKKEPAAPKPVKRKEAAPKEPPPAEAEGDDEQELDFDEE